MRSRPSLPLLTASLLAPALAPTVAHAQAATGGDEYAVCYRFAFGTWTPKLDLRAAGHDPNAIRAPDAPGGRSWAMDDKSVAEKGLLLFPAWWPAGVRIRFDGLPPVVGDTVSGTAAAFVANANVASPTAPVRAWGVRCGEPQPRGSAPSARPR